MLYNYGCVKRQTCRPFVAVEITWRNKHKSIQSIITLNVGKWQNSSLECGRCSLVKLFIHDPSYERSIDNTGFSSTCIKNIWVCSELKNCRWFIGVHVLGCNTHRWWLKWFWMCPAAVPCCIQEPGPGMWRPVVPAFQPLLLYVLRFPWPHVSRNG